MSNRINSSVTTTGIDIGKNAFHVVGLDHRGAIVPRQFFCQCSPSVPRIGMDRPTSLQCFRVGPWVGG